MGKKKFLAFSTNKWVWGTGGTGVTASWNYRGGGKKRNFVDFISGKVFWDKNKKGERKIFFIRKKFLYIYEKEHKRFDGIARAPNPSRKSFLLQKKRTLA